MITATEGNEGAQAEQSNPENEGKRGIMEEEGLQEKRREEKEEKEDLMKSTAAIQTAAIIRSTVDTLDKECRVNTQCLYVWRYD